MTITNENTRYNICNMRLPSDSKPYYQNQLQEFADHMADKLGTTLVEYGKQDIRGGFSICLYNDNHCVTQQRHFRDKSEMLGFIVGYNQALSNVKYI